jgi:hypothetical protein
MITQFLAAYKKRVAQGGGAEVSISDMTVLGYRNLYDNPEAGIMFAANGSIMTGYGNKDIGYPTNSGTWLNSGSAGDYEVRMTLVSGTLQASGYAVNTWYALSTDSQYAGWNTRNSLGNPSESRVLTAEIRRVSDSLVVDSATITITINYN